MSNPKNNLLALAVSFIWLLKWHDENFEPRNPKQGIIFYTDWKRK